MTKKDYKTLAMVFKPYYDTTESLQNTTDDRTTRYILIDLVAAIRKNDPNFDAIKFLDIIRGYGK